MGPLSSGPVIGNAIRAKTEQKVQKPSLYNVIMHNDDYTPMRFVQDMLMRHFNKSSDTAYAMMMRVHREGAVTAGTYTLEIAETKVDAVMDEAKKNEHPFRLSVERA